MNRERDTISLEVQCSGALDHAFTAIIIHNNITSGLVSNKSIYERNNKKTLRENKTAKL